ncbi:MAG: hypothetical protein E7612_04705 [Ruminococcaceae bacterium]|nr:hypothetical protein [Oscillospiraceae bacterium]
MKKIIDELWYGNISSEGAFRISTKEDKKLMREISSYYDKLSSELTNTQKELLKKFDDCYAELIALAENQSFNYGFRLGAKIVIEIYNDESL